MKISLVFILMILCMQASFCQSFKASVNDLSFMAGKWFQAHQWGDMEEYWGKPMGDNMISSYRCVKDGKVLFYEFVVIEQTDSVPVMKLRHFNRGSIAWEDKGSPLSYPLIQLTKNKAVFEALDKSLKMTYERSSEKTMEILLQEKTKEGEWKTEKFNYSLLEK